LKGQALFDNFGHDDDDDDDNDDIHLHTNTPTPHTQMFKNQVLPNLRVVVDALPPAIDHITISTWSGTPGGEVMCDCMLSLEKFQWDKPVGSTIQCLHHT
jgi:hypothetical protein